MSNKDQSEKPANILPDLKIALINYNRTHDDTMRQADVAPGYESSQIHNVATGRSTSKALRDKIETFIKENT